MALKPEAAGSTNLPAVLTDVRDLVEPIVVPNTLWQSSNPVANNGGQESDITHLREFEASGAGRRG